MKSITITESPTLGICLLILGMICLFYGLIGLLFPQDEIARNIAIGSTGLAFLLLPSSLILFRNRPTAIVISESGIYIKQFSVKLDWKFIRDAKLYYPYLERRYEENATKIVLTHGAAAKYSMLAFTFTEAGIKKYGRCKFVAQRHRSLMNHAHDVLIPISSLNLYGLKEQKIESASQLIEEFHARIRFYNSM